MDDPVWDEFRSTCVRIEIADNVFDVVPNPRDPAVGEFPAGIGDDPIHILTAQNPMGLAAPDAANAAANERMSADLAALDTRFVWPATGYGGGPPDDDGTWQEQGFAVVGLTDRAALDLAIRHHQRAIFIWRNEPGGFRLVACDGSADESRGWSATTIPKMPDLHGITATPGDR